MNASVVEALVGKLDLRATQLSACPACLVSVSSALESGDAREIRRALRFFGPLLWDEGLDAPVLAVLAAARDGGVDGAREAIADAEGRRGRAPVFLAVVRRLALMQREEAERSYIAAQS